MQFNIYGLSAIYSLVRYKYRFTSKTAAITIAFCLVNIVLANFISIKFHGVIPMPLYAYYPFTSVTMMSSCLGTLLPQATGIYESSAEIARKWNTSTCNTTVGLNRNMFKRQVRSVQKIGMVAGFGFVTFKTLQRAFKAEFVIAVLEYTINAVLSFDSA